MAVEGEDLEMLHGRDRGIEVRGAKAWGADRGGCEWRRDYGRRGQGTMPRQTEMDMEGRQTDRE